MRRARFTILLGALTLLACERSKEVSETAAPEPADTVFVGAHIITMDPDRADATGVAVRGDSIVMVGDRAAAMALVGEDTRVVELGDRALLPGFVDSHGHAGAIAQMLDQVNLSSPPVGTVENIDDIIKVLKEHVAAKPPRQGDWLIGRGYDDSLLAEGRHPNRDDLDQVSKELPIFLSHVSGHLGVANSAALVAANMNADTKDPPGGVIRRRAGSREPNGVLEETAAFGFRRVAATAPERLETSLREMARQYASYGITTVQDGAAAPASISAFRRAAANEPFPVDIAAYRHISSLAIGDLGTFTQDATYRNGFRVAGVKFSLDGSPQGRTAWLTQPYLERPPGVAQDYVAYPTVEPQAYKRQVAHLLQRGIPVLVHANGDAAIDLMIDGIQGGVGEGPIPDHRSVIIHAQLMRADQLDRAKQLRIVPSFFSAHTFFWGDWHRRSFGTRAENISPTRWARDKGVPFTIHNDAPVVPPDMMRLLWATVNRTTRSGDTIGPGQRISVYEALHALTLGGAYQYFEEGNKGSITQGKQADLVILGADPLMVDPNALKDLAIIETIARGRTVFSAN